jgi:four helix bundle protein
MKKSYRDLYIWQASVDLAARIIELTDAFPMRQRYVLAQQMQRAAISVPSNIAEGKGRLSPKELRHFLATARGSLFELESQIEIARRTGLITQAVYDQLDKQVAQIGTGIHRLIARLNI